MTESTFYICDICGKSFETEEECLKHEQKERYGADIFEHVWAWDSKGKPLSFDAYMFDPADAWYLLADTVQGRDFINGVFYDDGYERPYDNDETRGLSTLVYYNDGAYEWHSWEQLLQDTLKQRDQLQGYPLPKE